MIKIHFMMATLFFITFAYGGTIRGNGGDSVQCPEGIYFYDIYEAKVLRSWTFENPPTLEQVLKKMKVLLDSNDYEILLSWISTFEEDTQYVRNVKLGNVDDSYRFVVPPQCEVVPTALGQTSVPLSKPYIVRQDIFEHLSHWEQDALRLHEVIYRRFVQIRKNKNWPEERIFNSESVRNLVSALYSDQVEDFSIADWEKILGDFKLK